MSLPDPPPERFSPDDALPPVQPPTAGFVLQLFVIPAVIVLLIVTVWLLFNWLAQRGEDPDQYVKALARDNVARWQVAVNLANALRNPRNQALREDRRLAGDLVEILKRDLAANRQDDADLRLRLFLSKALGEFAVGEGVDVLVDVERQSRDPRQWEVRIAALEALSLLASRVGEAEPGVAPKAQAVLLEASRDDDAQIRARAAFGLGATDGPQGHERLALLLDDVSPYVRFNAANGLARHGDPRALEVLLETLDPQFEFRDPDADEPADIAAARAALVQLNSIRAAGQLVAANPSLDTRRLSHALERLRTAEVGGQIRVAATELANRLARPAAQPAEAR